MDYTPEMAFTIGILWIPSLILYFLIVGLCVLIGIYFLKISRNKWENRLDVFLFFVSLFFITLGVGYVFRIIFMFFVPADLEQFYVQLIERTDPTIQQLSKIHGTFNYIGIAFLSAGVEHTILKKKTHYLFSISTATSIIVILVIMPYEMALTYQIIPILLSFFVVIVFVFIYFYLAYKHAGIVRKNSLFVGIGLLLFIIAMALNAHGVLTDVLFSGSDIQTVLKHTIVAPILFIVGIILLYNGYK